MIRPQQRSTGERGAAADRAKCVRCAYNLTWVGLWDSLFLAIFKGTVGYFTHSRALTMSAVYSIHDVISALAILLGLKVAESPADAEHPYGYGEMENVVSLLTGIIILVATLFLMAESMIGLLNGHYPKPHWVALIGALIATLVNETIYHYNICAWRHINSPAILTHAQHHRADAISSLAAVFGILGAKLGYYFLDPLVAIFEAGHLILLSVEILYHSGMGLLDRSPEQAQLMEIRDVASQAAGAGIMKNIKARQVGRYLWVDMHLGLPEDTPMGEAEQISMRIRQSLRRYIRDIGNVNVIYE